MVGSVTNATQFFFLLALLTLRQSVHGRLFDSRKLTATEGGKKILLTRSPSPPPPLLSLLALTALAEEEEEEESSSSFSLRPKSLSLSLRLFLICRSVLPGGLVYSSYYTTRRDF